MSAGSARGAGQFGGRRDISVLASNALSLAMLALSGIAINALLAAYSGVNSVGQFNQLAALQLVIAQFAAFGIHLSCLHYLSAETVGSKTWASGVRAALLVVAVIGAVVTVILELGAKLIEDLLGSPGLADGIRWVAPAIALLGINKIVFAICNAGDRLHTLAFLQALRPTAWLGGMAALVLFGSAEPGVLGQILFLAEAVTALFGLVVIPDIWRSSGVGVCRSWIVRHLRFGVRAMPSHLIVDLNTRIDVLLLAYFAADEVVGIYSFVSLLAEGVFQIGAVIRTLINRRLVGLLLGRNDSGLQVLRRLAGRWSLALTMAAALVLAAAFSPVIEWLALDPLLVKGEFALWVLLVGVVACAAASPFWMALVLAGRPVEHTELMLALCALNVALNVAFIPVMGMLGAAVGTAVMMASFPFLLSWTSKRVLGMLL